MNKPRISVVTPSFNQGEFLERTMHSVLGQDYPDIEYFVMDGGSNDSTVDVIERFEGKLAGWVSEPDRGQAHAVNKGFGRVTGEIVGWLNSDDQYFSNDVLASVADFFGRHADVDVLYGDNIYVDEDDRLLFFRRGFPFFRPYVLRHWNFIHQPTVFFRRHVVKKYVLDEKLHYVMDYDFWMRLASAGVRFKYLNRVIAASRWHSSCKTQMNGNQVFDEVEQMYLHYPRKLGWVGARLWHSVMFSLTRLASIPRLIAIASRGGFTRFTPG